jgi:arabinofuranosyltransferase
MSDDGYIAFQYVRNLVRGEGLVYNSGERVEGYNNFLWIIMLAGFSRLLPSVDLMVISKALGILFGALTIVLVCRFSWMVRKESGPFCLLAGAFLAFHSGLAAWSTGGLETTLFAFLLFAAAYAYVFYMRTGRNFLLVPLVFGLAALTRPDAILLFGVTSAHALFLEWRRTRKILSLRLVAWGLVFLAIYVPYYVWRYSYYGYPMPNTFYTKVGSTYLQYIRGARYLLDYMKWFGGFIFALPLVALLRKNREPWRDYVALLVGVYFIYLVYVGGDGLAFYRFVVYIAPLMYVLAQEGFADLYERIRQSRFATRRWALAAPALVLVLISLGFTMRLTVFPLLFPKDQQWYEPHSELNFPGDAGHPYVWFDNYFVDRLAVAARWLEANAPEGAVVASTPAGSIAYHMNHKVIDMLGLNDIHIARTVTQRMGKGRAGHEKGDGKYVLSRSPDFILMGNVAVLSYPVDEATMAKKIRLKSENELWDDPEFHRNYELECVRLADSGPFQYFTFYKKKGLVLPAQPEMAARESNGGAQ